MTEYTPKPFQSEEKRFYLPGVVIKARCPACGCVAVRDFGAYYLSNPVFNEVSEFWLEECTCEGTEKHRCYEEVPFSYSLKLSLEVDIVDGT